MTALTGKSAPADHYGTVIDARGKAAMNAKQLRDEQVRDFTFD